MKIEEFLGALVAEIDGVEPDVAAWSATLSAPDSSDATFVDALEGFCGQLERLGETCTMLGLGGLASWCTHFSGQLPALAQVDTAERPLHHAFLTGWCTLWRAWLAEPAQFDVSMALVEHLSIGPVADALPEDQSLALIELLTLAPELPAELAAAAEEAIEDIEVTEADVSLELPDTSDHDVYTAFMDEAPDNASALSTLMFKIADGVASPDDMTNAKRIAHSFKGSANIVGIRGIAAMAHQSEDLLEVIEKDPGHAPMVVRSTLAEAAACIEQMVYALTGEEEAPENAFDILQRITLYANAARRGSLAEVVGAIAPSGRGTDDALSGVASQPGSDAVAGNASGPEPAGQPVPLASPKAPAAADEKEATLRVPASVVGELLRLVSELTVRLARMDDQTRRAMRAAEDAAVQHRVLRQKIDDLDKLVTIRGMVFQAEDAGVGVDPLELEQYNELYGISRAVQEAASDAGEIGRVLRTEIASMEQELGIQAKLGRNLSRAVIGVRMLPVANLFPRLARTVRQTVTATAKQAELQSDGGDIMIDSDMLGALADPLLHILRNAVDHGIETPEVRLAAGKPASGTIHLRVSRIGNSVKVLVTDDGAGLNLSAIAAKAIERGLIESDVVLDDAALAQLILLPGFSTRDQVTEVSGRGVGMDVVASRVRDLNGTLEIRTASGQGCEIELRFQASLVSQHALLVRSSEQIFALPSHQIVLGLPAGGAPVTQEGSGYAIEALGERWGIRSLAALAGLASPPTANQLATQSLVLFRSGGQSLALAVDRIVDGRELIIQPVPQILKFLRGVSGAAILGDGSVAPLLDPAELAQRPLAGLGISQARLAQMAQVARQQARRVVVVDDSLSARKAVAQLLRDAGFEVFEAVDGLAAIPIIVREQPHAVVTDLEMPNMNGVELTGYLRADPALTALPVVMITSRTMARHREMADRAGVSAYLTKPYSDADLLRTVGQLVTIAPTASTEPALLA